MMMTMMGGSGSGLSFNSSSSSRQLGTGTCLRCCLPVFVIALTMCMFGPALYWKLKKGTLLGHSHSSISCPPCICDCPPPLSILKIVPGLANLSTEECGRGEPEVEEEMQKQYAELLIEELKLQEIVASEQMRHMNATYREARRVGSQYQREAEKCTVATETCEEAREQAEALLRKEMKQAFLWEHRARTMGWDSEDNVNQ